jgi:hypothetical protein
MKFGTEVPDMESYPNLDQRPNMTAPDPPATPSAGEVQELLLRYLLRAAAPAWPGADGLTLDEVVRSYPEAAAAHIVPDQEWLGHRHPHLRDKLDHFFTGLADAAGLPCKGNQHDIAVNTNGTSGPDPGRMLDGPEPF